MYIPLRNSGVKWKKRESIALNKVGGKNIPIGNGTKVITLDNICFYMLPKFSHNFTPHLVFQGCVMPNLWVIGVF